MFLKRLFVINCRLMKREMRSTDDKLNMNLKSLEDEKRCSSYNEIDENLFESIIQI